MNQQYSSSLNQARQFLRTVLQQVSQYQGNAQQIYPLWAQYPEQFNETLLEAISVVTSLLSETDRETQLKLSFLLFKFSELIKSFPYGNRAINLDLTIVALHKILPLISKEFFPDQWAATVYDLANTYYNRVRGERAENLEQAIELYHQVLQVWTRDQFPDYWAGTVLNLANAYCGRIRGERAENIEQAIELYYQVLQILSREQFPNYWAGTVNKLAHAYSNRIRGEQAENLEQAIKLYQQALQVYTREQFPVDWAMTVNKLAHAYSNRIRGKRAENLEQEIKLYQQSLQVWTREQFPDYWATTVLNLANAYCGRIRGERAENLEQAIDLCYQVLQIRTREQFPTDWANTVSHLARAYIYRIRGERAENLEQAIDLYQQVLQVYTREQFPDKWALTVHNLAAAYIYRIRGERAENLEQAIDLCYQSLQVRTREQFPLDWATTVNILAFVYSNRIRGKRAKNLEQAIDLCHQVLQVRTREQFPLEWAQTVNNLASTYADRLRGERAENLEQAIQLYHQVLQVRTREQFPEEWAQTVNNLAFVYSNRLRGERAENLEQAIQLYHQVLQVWTREQFPTDWATTVNNLASTYADRLRGERAENLERAIDLYGQALQVYTPDNFPNDSYRVGRSLGYLGFSEGDWEVAIKGYAIATEAIECSRSWATNETSRQEIQAGAVDLYAQMVQACINAGRLDLALETVERSRSRRLVELMSINDFYQDRDTPTQVQSYLQEYETLQRQIDGLRSDLRITSESKLVGAESSMRSRAAWGAVGQHIQELEQQKQTMRQQISRLDPVSAGLLEVRALNLTELQQLIDRPNTALLSFYNTADSTYIFVLRQNQLTYHPCLGQGDTLQEWLFNQWLLPYLSIRRADDGAIQRLPRSSWKSNLPDLLAELSQRLQIEELIQNHLQAIDELILVPHLGLHQIPFAALPTSQGTLGDRFTLRVVPSCQVLQFCHQRPPLTPSLLGMIEDASGDLPCSSFEAESVATLYNVPPELRLRGPREATVGNYKHFLREKQIQMLLSCHHAQSRLDNPLESKLVLADGDITLGELLSPAWRLPQLADVFLSCCETGLGRALDSTDDILTLATGFLCAGARSVISTLWSVDDLATAIFSILYHQNRHKTHGNMNRPQALQRAQQTLREMTGSNLDQAYRPKLEAMLNVKYDEADNNRRQATTEQERKYWAGVAIRIGDMLDRLENLCVQPYPFEHPIYWAGFVCHGLR